MELHHSCRDGKTSLNLSGIPNDLVLSKILCVCVCAPVSVCVHYECTCVFLSFKALLKTAEATLFSNSCFSSFLLWIGPLTDGGNSTWAKRAPPPPPKGMPCPSGHCLMERFSDAVFLSLYHWVFSVHVIKSLFHAMLWLYTCWQKNVCVCVEERAKVALFLMINTFGLCHLCLY